MDITRRRASRVVLFTTAVAVLLLPHAAAAQTKTPTSKGDRGRLAIGGIYQTSADTVSSTVNFTVNAETTSFTSSSRPKPKAGFGADVAIRVVRRLWVGIGYSSWKSSAAATVKASLPHPFFFNQARTIEGSSDALEHNETAVHVRLEGSTAVGRLTLAAFAGPTRFTVQQRLVDTVTYTESYPYDSATFKGATTSTHSKSATGFHGGVDLAYPFSKSVGIGAGVVFSSGTVSLAASDGSSVSVKVGGLQVSAGLRFRF